MDDDEAWLQGDATDEALAAGGHGAAIDSRRYGPVPVDALVARAWFRYGRGTASAGSGEVRRVARSLIRASTPGTAGRPRASRA